MSPSNGPLPLVGASSDSIRNDHAIYRLSAGCLYVWLQMGCSGSKKPVLPVPPPAPEQQHQGSEARTEARSAEPAHGVQAKKSAGQAIPAPVPITIVPVATAAGAAAGVASPPAEGVDVNYRPPQEGVTALISAIKRGDMNSTSTHSEHVHCTRRSGWRK